MRWIARDKVATTVTHVANKAGAPTIKVIHGKQSKTLYLYLYGKQYSM